MEKLVITSFNSTYYFHSTFKNNLNYSTSMKRANLNGPTITWNNNEPMLRKQFPLDGTHLDAVRGLFQLRGFTQVRQRRERRCHLKKEGNGKCLKGKELLQKIIYSTRTI